MTNLEDYDNQLTFSELEERLTDKQAKFCREYILDLNATQAAIRAGYSGKTARSTGSENLTKPDVIAFLDALRSDLMSATGITKEAIALELIAIARAKATDSGIKTSDRVNAYRELNRIFGHYAPTKSEVKAEVGYTGIVTLDDYAN